MEEDRQEEEEGMGKIVILLIFLLKYFSVIIRSQIQSLHVRIRDKTDGEGVKSNEWNELLFMQSEMALSPSSVRSFSCYISNRVG